MTTRSRRSILLVDDDPAGAELTQAALAMIDPAMQVDIVCDGEEALEYVFRRGRFERLAGGLPDALLLDLKMPKVDGHEVLRQIRADPRLGDLKVIVLTSSDQARDRNLSRELGSNAYLVKPGSLAALLEQLRACPELQPAGRDPAG